MLALVGLFRISFVHETVPEVSSFSAGTDVSGNADVYAQ